MRKIAANAELGSTAAANSTGEEEYQLFETTMWEKGTYNPVQVNTLLQAKQLAFGRPTIDWQDVPMGTAMVRKAFVEHVWDENALSEVVRDALLDMLISSTGSIYVGAADGEVVVRYADAVHVTYDPAFRLPHERRYVIEDEFLPASVAVERYPKLSTLLGGKKMDDRCRCTKVWSLDLKRFDVLHNNQIVDTLPYEEPYLPFIEFQFERMPGAAGATGSVEVQIPTLREQQDLHRAMRAMAQAHARVLLMVYGDQGGQIAQRIKSAGPLDVIEAASPSTKVEYTVPPPMPPALLQLLDVNEQHENAQSGITNAQRGNTDDNVKFATQLAMMEQESGIQEVFTSQRVEDGVRDLIERICLIGKLHQGPITLAVDGTQIEFDVFNPINLQLGDDGAVTFNAGGMRYQSPQQKIAKAVGLFQAITACMTLPPPMIPPAVKLVIDASDVDNKEEWMAAAAQLMAPTLPMPGQMPPGVPAGGQGMVPSQMAPGGPQPAFGGGGGISLPGGVKPPIAPQQAAN